MNQYELEEIRKKFFDTKLVQFPDKDYFGSMWEKLRAFEEKGGKPIEDGLTKEEYVSLYDAMSIRHSTVFDKMKVCLTFYMKFLVNEGVLPFSDLELFQSIKFSDVPVRSIGTVMFYKNIDQLIENIEDSKMSSDAYDTDRFDMAAGVLYLAWYGFTNEEIANAKKADVTKDGVYKSGSLVHMDKYVIKELLKLVDAEGYYQLARGPIFVRYVKTDFLIRTKKADRVKAKALNNVVWRINEVCDQRYSLSLGVVYKSGVFFRAYMEECAGRKLDLKDMGAVGRALKRKITTPMALRSAVNDYLRYKTLFE